MRRSALMTIVASVAFGGAVLAQDVSTAKKTSGPADIISGQSGNLQLRHYADGKMASDDRDKIVGFDITTQARANFVVNTFKDLAETWFILGATKKNSTSQVTQRRPQIYTEVYAYKSDFFDVTPYLDVRTPMGGSATRGDLGVIPALKAPKMNTGAGELSLSFHIEAEAQLHSEKEDITARDVSESDSTEFGLTANDSGDQIVEDGRKSPAYEVIYVPKASLNMDKLVKGFRVTPYVEYVNTYTPVLKKEGDDLVEVYEPSRSTVTYLRLDYKLTDSTTLTNFTWANNEDLYGARGDGSGTRFTNLARVTYSMY